MTDTTTDDAEIESTLASIKKLLLVGGLFAAVGYLLILGALALELTQFHPLLETFSGSSRITAWLVVGPSGPRAR